MKRLSIVESDKIADLYQEILNEDMDAGGLMGGVPTHGGDLVNHDDYAPGDNRKPYVLGTQTRKGKLKIRKNKNKSKKPLDFPKNREKLSVEFPFKD